MTLCDCRDWPLEHARAIIQGRIGLTSIFAEHLSESAPALFIKPKGRRASEKQKTHLAFAVTRQRRVPRLLCLAASSALARRASC